MPYSVHLQLHEDQYSEEQVEEWFDQFVEEYDDVERGREPVEKSVDPAIVISGATLVVTSIDTLLTIYSEIKRKREVHYANLWGPDSEKYPVQVYTNALGRIENPGQYDFYEADGDVTLVVCDSTDEVRKVQADVDPDGLVEDLDDAASDLGSEKGSEKE
jgi:hypothetical protein